MLTFNSLTVCASVFTLKLLPKAYAGESEAEMKTAHVDEHNHLFPGRRRRKAIITAEVKRATFFA